MIFIFFWQWLTFSQLVDDVSQQSKAIASFLYPFQIPPNLQVGLILYIAEQVLHHLISVSVSLAKTGICLHPLDFLDCFDCFGVRSNTINFKRYSIFSDSLTRENRERRTHAHAHVSAECFELALQVDVHSNVDICVCHWHSLEMRPMITDMVMIFMHVGNTLDYGSYLGSTARFRM